MTPLPRKHKVFQNMPDLKFVSPNMPGVERASTDSSTHEFSHALELIVEDLEDLEALIVVYHGLSAWLSAGSVPVLRAVSDKALFSSQMYLSDSIFRTLSRLIVRTQDVKVVTKLLMR